GLAYWAGGLTAGLFTRLQVVSAIDTSLEYRINVVQGLYMKYLHRAADALGLVGLVNFLAAGGTIEQEKAILLGSAEYYTNRGGGTNNGFLTALYQDVLERTIDTAGQNFFNQELALGFSRTTVATQL